MVFQVTIAIDGMVPAQPLTAGQFGAQFVHEISPWCGVVVNWVLVLELEILFLIKPNDA